MVISFMVLGIVTAEPGIGATTWSIAHMGSSSIGSFVDLVGTWEMEIWERECFQSHTTWVKFVDYMKLQVKNEVVVVTGPTVAIPCTKKSTGLRVDDIDIFEINEEPQISQNDFKKDSKIVKAKVEMKSLALKGKKESSNEECSTSGSKDEEYAMAMCLGVELEPDEWIKDNGCSKHMTGNRQFFSSYKAYNRGNVIFGSNLRGSIIGKEPKNVNEALGDESWIIAMQEELNQFIANDVWKLFPQLRNMKIIGTKWVFRNKLDENGVVSRNKARLVAQGYNQQEGIDYDKTYAPVARLESIRILLAYACVLDFKLFQMDVKSAFLNGFINEDVYVAQPPGFIDFEKPDHVYKLNKALYGLKQAPKAWYDRLKSFLIKHEYKIGMVDNTLFTKKTSSNLFIVQIYVDDIIFGSTCQDMCDEFTKIMHDEFEMSMMGEPSFFLGLQMKDIIFFNQSKYIKKMLKKFRLEDSKPMKTPMSSHTKLTKYKECESVDSTKYRGMIGSLLYLTTSRPDVMFSLCLCACFQEAPKTSHLEAVKRIFRYIKGTMHLGLWYPKGIDIETVVYADFDHAGDYVDRKSTSGICTFVRCCLTSWFSKKQTALAISTTEAEYVSAKKACKQTLWMKQALIDYDIRLDDVPIT
nr:retrovirus-related Pol polyprotein from transposon TNT 1-94 [Tanacetum cinerariifolium]